MAEWEHVLQEQMTEVLTQLREQDFEPPLYCAFVDGNGSMVYGRYDESEGNGLHFTVVASHMEEDDFTLPINVMFVDQHGEAAYVAVDTQDEPPAFLN